MTMLQLSQWTRITSLLTVSNEKWTKNEKRGKKKYQQVVCVILADIWTHVKHFFFPYKRENKNYPVNQVNIKVNWRKSSNIHKRKITKILHHVVWKHSLVSNGSRIKMILHKYRGKNTSLYRWKKNVAAGRSDFPTSIPSVLGKKFKLYIF